MTAPRNGTVTTMDGIGTWNADVDRGSNSACTLIEVANYQNTCYVPGDISVTFTQYDTSSILHSYTRTIPDNEPFVVLVNLLENAALSLASTSPTTTASLAPPSPPAGSP